MEFVLASPVALENNVDQMDVVALVVHALPDRVAQQHLNVSSSVVMVSVTHRPRMLLPVPRIVKFVETAFVMDLKPEPVVQLIVPTSVETLLVKPERIQQIAHLIVSDVVIKNVKLVLEKACSTAPKIVELVVTMFAISIPKTLDYVLKTVVIVEMASVMLIRVKTLFHVRLIVELMFVVMAAALLANLHKPVLRIVVPQQTRAVSPLFSILLD